MPGCQRVDRDRLETDLPRRFEGAVGIDQRLPVVADENARPCQLAGQLDARGVRGEVRDPTECGLEIRQRGSMAFRRK